MPRYPLGEIEPDRLAEMKDPLLIDVPTELLGARIKLRKYSKDDALAVNEAIEESRADFAPYFSWANTKRSIEERQADLLRGASGWILRTAFGFGMWRTEDDTFLGEIGLWAPEWQLRRFEIGYWLRSSAVGNGYVTEASALLCDLAFHTFEARRVCIQCDAINVKSAGVAKRLGFELEGTLRNNALSPTGEIRDSVIFGMTPDRWLTRSS